MLAGASQTNCYYDYHPGGRAAAVQEPAVGYAQAGVEQWVRQQNASRQKQEQMAASSVYAGQMYRSYDQIPESGNYCYWSGHHKPVSSLDLGPNSYGNIDSAMNVHLHRKHFKIPDDSLTLEQQQQRQNKIGRLQVIRQLLTADQQVHVSDEHVDHISPAGFAQSRVPAAGGWNTMPCDDDMYAGRYNSGSQMMNSNYASSAMRRHCHPTGWDVTTMPQQNWYHIQYEHHTNQMGMQNDMYRCQPTDDCNSSIRYFEPCAPLHSPDKYYQLSVRDRVMPARDCTAVYPSCDPQACMCEGCLSSRMGKHHMLPSGTYRYADVGMQPNYGCQQQVNRCNEFMNYNYRMPVGGSRQPTYGMLGKSRGDSSQNWNTGESIMKRQLMPAPAVEQFDGRNQQVMPTRQLSNSYCTDRHVAEPVSTVVSCAPAPAQIQMPAVAVRHRQPSGNKKRKNNSIFTAQPDSKSRKLDSREWPSEVSATKSGTLMNITSASLAHLAKGVENMSAVMQQTIHLGGPFQSVRGSNDHADGSDENANFIPAGNSLQIQSTGVLNLGEEKTAAVSGCTSVSHVHGNASKTGIDVVVMPKAPYTISYRPTGTSSEGDSQHNVDVRNASAAAFSHNAMMMQQSDVAHHLSRVDTAPYSCRNMPSSEGFSQLSNQKRCGTCHMNAADAAKVDQQAAATDMCLSMASSVAVIQPQMMSGTQLFIADRCSESAPVFNNFVLPTGVSSSAFMSPQHSHSMQHGPNYPSFAVQCVPLSKNIPGLCSPPNAVKPNTDQLQSSVCTSNSVKSLSDSVAGGSPLLKCAQSTIGVWHQPSVSVCSTFSSQTPDAAYAVRNAQPGSGVATSQT